MKFFIRISIVLSYIVVSSFDHVSAVSIPNPAQAPNIPGPDRWYPSRFGQTDELGATNYLTDMTALAAVQLVRKGRTYSLGVPIDSQTPSYPPRTFNLTVLFPGQPDFQPIGVNKGSYFDDIVNAWVGSGSQIDGLGHVGIDGRYYNGFRAQEIYQSAGLRKLGVHNIPPIVTRGIVIDMAEFNSVEMLTEGEFGLEDVKSALHKSGLYPRRGDVVLFHTGWLDGMMHQNSTRFIAGEPGIDAATAEFLANLEVVAVGADTWGLEGVPNAAGLFFPAHQVLLTKYGVHVLEMMDVGKLVKDGVKEFLFVLGVPRYRGGVQAMVNPIAIV